MSGEVSLSEITRYINDGCAKADKTHQLEEVKLPALPSDESASRLADNGWFHHLASRLILGDADKTDYR